MREEILESFRRNEFFFHGQKIVKNSTDDVLFIEALIRKKDNEKVLSPFHFIDDLEGALINTDVSEELIKLMRNFALEVKYHGYPAVSFNFTCEQLSNPEIVASVIGSFKDIISDNFSLIIEIVERRSVERCLIVNNALKDFCDNKIQISLDDFLGNHLSDCPNIYKYISSVKFEREALHEIINLEKNLENNIAQVITKALKISDSNYDKIIFEGVENEFEMNILKSMGYFSHQGYYYDLPSELSAK